jgi:CubicO group peptidase (beta-lactamase class C family)
VRAVIAQRPDFSGVVLVARGERVLVEEAHGLADRAAGTKVAIDTKFNIASIGKIFTKLALAQLAAAGKLALSDRSCAGCPAYRVEGAPKITLTQLTEHRGGVDDVLDRVHGVPDRTTLDDARRLAVAHRDRPLVFEPGTSQRYSNGGYVLLGGAIAQASGEDYYDYVKRHVLDPAGMADTGWPPAHQPLARRAEGYTRHPEGLRHAEAQSCRPPPRRRIQDLLPERGSPAGGATSTAPDLLKLHARDAGKPLAPAPWTAVGAGRDPNRRRAQRTSCRRTTGSASPAGRRASTA